MSAIASKGSGLPSKGRGSANATCFKCGKSGHWARDCTASLEQRNNHSAGKQDTVNLREKDDNKIEEQNPSTDPPKKRSVKRRPKLTWELLTGPNGLSYVYTKLPYSFKQQFKGRGHEVGDLGRLLALYNAWQRQLHPNAASFDEFVADVEKFSSQGTVKGQLREMRKNMLKLAGVDLSAPAGGLAGLSEDDCREEPMGEVHNSGGGGAENQDTSNGNELDDEELLELQAQNFDDSAAGPRGGSAPDTAADAGLDDEEAAALEEALEEGGADPAGGLDDEELAELELQMLEG